MQNTENDESNIFLATGSSHLVNFKRKAQNNKVLTHTYEIMLFSQRIAKLFCSHLLWQNKWRFFRSNGNFESVRHYSLVVEIRTELSADLSWSCNSTIFTV